jgi:hypothetical protein
MKNPKPTLIHFVEDLALIPALYLHSQERLWRSCVTGGAPIALARHSKMHVGLGQQEDFD